MAAEFVSLSQDDFELYAAQMEQVKARVNAALGFFALPPAYPSVEAGLLQLRLALETVVMSSLVSNRSAIERVTSSFAQKDYKKALALAKEANPSFWPQPSEQRLDTETNLMRMWPITTGYLTEDEYKPTWGRLSAWLHATNPFKAMPTPVEGANFGREVIGKLTTLLNHHSVRLADRDELLVCIMSELETDRVHVFGFSR
ncbi:hypothetical protein ACFQ9V_01060 [Leifsonia sp. NPDC056665]|uniref:hypothetical protein n=1 Tax=Leifsonia sp. NPDC056665 TaxID=3345901 RepID=UPI0036819B01